MLFSRLVSFQCKALRAGLSLIVASVLCSTGVSVFCSAGLASTSPKAVAPPVLQNAGSDSVAPVLTAPEVKFTPGQPLNISTDVEDLKATYDLDLARKQVAAYPESAEAHFILAVALTRTCYVDQALREIQRARRLAESSGGPSYFDKMISTYEELLKNYPDENQVRYELAWAYYMKSYLVASHYQRMHNTQRKAGLPLANGHHSPDIPWEQAAVAGSNGASESEQVKKYNEAALQKLDDLLTRDPLDVWAISYRAFLKAQFSGDLETSMNTWKNCLERFPNNPVPYFFLGEGYLKQGNLKESLRHVSKAVSLRSAATQQ